LPSPAALSIPSLHALFRSRAKDAFEPLLLRLRQFGKSQSRLVDRVALKIAQQDALGGIRLCHQPLLFAAREIRVHQPGIGAVARDRKSTRLNSSHASISYA